MIPSVPSARVQLLMGEGKTTVISPLLALLLASSQRLFVLVVPDSLLAFARQVNRQTFSAIFVKPVLTFAAFDRDSIVDSDLMRRLVAARDTGAVVLATGGAIKASVLHFVEVAHHIEQCGDSSRSTKRERDAQSFLRSGGGGAPAAALLGTLTSELAASANLLALIRRKSVFIIDEVDLMLRPSTSELNWPLGDAVSLDALLWSLPTHLLHLFQLAVTYESRTAERDYYFSFMSISNSSVARSCVEKLVAAIAAGTQRRAVTRSPHVVLAEPDAYASEWRRCFAEWAAVYIHHNVIPKTRVAELSVARLSDMIMQSAFSDSFAANAKSPRPGGASPLGAAEHAAVELARQWCNSILPFVFAKVHRLHFGRVHEQSPEARRIMAAATQAGAAFDSEEAVKQSRRNLLAIPFCAKE